MTCFACRMRATRFPIARLPLYPLHAPCSLAELQAMVPALADAFDAPPGIELGQPPRLSARQNDVAADRLRLRGLRGGRRTTLAFRQRVLADDRTRHGTIVRVAVEAAPLEIHLYEAPFAIGPTLVSPLGSHILQGSPRELVLTILDAEAAAALVACRALLLDVSAGTLALQVPGWVAAPGDARALLELGAALAARVPAAIEELASARARAEGHGDTARARVALHAAWDAETAARKLELDQASRRAGRIVFWCLLVLVGGMLIVGIVLFALR
jgi:hypothetical protein